MTLTEFTDWLLVQSDPAIPLRLADKYIKHYNEVGPTQFVLPKKDERLAPVIEAFANDLENFVLYLKGVRDETKSRELNALYRTVLTRHTQVVRRERLARAVAAKKPDNAVAYTKKLEQSWGRERLDYMAQYRYGSQRLTTDERADVLADFWQMIDNRIADGELPDE